MCAFIWVVVMALMEQTSSSIIMTNRKRWCTLLKDEFYWSLDSFLPSPNGTLTETIQQVRGPTETLSHVYAVSKRELKRSPQFESGEEISDVIFSLTCLVLNVHRVQFCLCSGLGIESRSPFYSSCHLSLMELTSVTLLTGFIWELAGWHVS